MACIWVKSGLDKQISYPNHKPNITNVIIFNSSDTKKFFFIFLQDIRKFEEVGGAGFLELIQHTMEHQHKSSTPLRAKDVFFYLIKQ